jgi:hypothetical protein
MVNNVPFSNNNPTFFRNHGTIQTTSYPAMHYSTQEITGNICPVISSKRMPSESTNMGYKEILKAASVECTTSHFILPLQPPQAI